MRKAFNVGAAANQRCLEGSLPCNEPLLHCCKIHRQCFNDTQKCLNCSWSVKQKMRCYKAYGNRCNSKVSLLSPPFLATLVALHFTPVSKSVSRSFELAKLRGLRACFQSCSLTLNFVSIFSKGRFQLKAWSNLCDVDMLIYEDQVVVYLYPPILFRLRYKNIYYVNHIVRTGVYFYNIYRLTHIYKYDMIYIREITVHISHWARSHWALLEGLELELRALLEGLEFELRGLLLIGRGFESWLRGRWNEPLPAIEPWLQCI